MKARRKSLRKQYCNRPETRSYRGRTHKSFTANAAPLLKRFLLTLPALWLVLTLVFLMIHIVPGDPVEQMLGEGAAPGQLPHCIMHWDWIYGSARSMDTTCGNLATAILGNPSS